MLEAGKLLDGRYRLEQRIGAGGAGEVWRARHVTLDSIVAVKVLHVLSSHREVARKRFLQEARLTAQLRIRQAVRVHDFGFVEERPFLVMELLEGETLKAMLAKKSRLPVRDTAILLRQAARALERAHALGIVHRDFKPDNVFVLLDEDGEPDVRVVDFGIAKLIGGFDADQDESEGIPSSDREQLLHFTRTGGVLGTPYYMAPEQVQSNPDLGLEVDVWAFGVVAYECLTGHRPFDGNNAGLLFKAILESDHIPAHERVPDVPRGFTDWFHTACAPDPKRRFTDVRTAVGALEDALGVLPVLGPSWLEATDPSTSLRTARPSSVAVTSPETGSSLSGTATSVGKGGASRQRVLVALLGALLLGAAVVVGILAGKPDSSSVPAAVDSHDVPDSQPVVSAAKVPDPEPPATASAEPILEPSAGPSAAPPVATRVAKARPPRHASPQKTTKPRVESQPAPSPAHPPEPPPTATKTQPSPLSLPPLGL